METIRFLCRLDPLSPLAYGYHSSGTRPLNTYKGFRAKSMIVFRKMKVGRFRYVPLLVDYDGNSV